jgi:hypothetical protein
MIDDVNIGRFSAAWIGCRVTLRSTNLNLNQQVTLIHRHHRFVTPSCDRDCTCPGDFVPSTACHAFLPRQDHAHQRRHGDDVPRARLPAM